MANLSFGDQAPWFTAPTLDGSPHYALGAAAGRIVLILFAGSAGLPACDEALRVVEAHRALFDDEGACFFGISTDPEDVSQRRISRRLPGVRWFLDHDRAVSRLYGAVVAEETGGIRYAPHFLLFDHRLRVVERFSVGNAEAALQATKRHVGYGVEVRDAPVLVVPRVFEPEVCRHLIALYDKDGGAASGFMRERDGMTVYVLDHEFKRRSDHLIQDIALQNALKSRLVSRLLPEIERAFQYEATRVERWLIACYESGDGDQSGGFFKARRDNTTQGTAHRRFACIFNLNSEEFEGGELRFPEYGPRRYRAPTGGAVIFSCSLLHEALPVTAGRRYAFLPFLYDEKAAELRERNKQYVTGSG
jgi:peroxiredoxin/predicted 2-oxoglutarate/Fe(II)-dependent dioxygenase YbiX